MKKLLLVLLVACTAAAAEKAPVREVFPNDYTPQPCATEAEAICESFAQGRMSSFASTFRGYNLSQRWVDAHWKEMTPLFRKICAKAGSCFTVQQNDWVFCLDSVREDFFATCDRFPEGTQDHEECEMFALTYYIGIGARTKLANEAKECAGVLVGTEGARTLQAWIEPAQIEHDFEGTLVVHVHDAQTHIPVRAAVTVDAGVLVGTEGITASALYPSRWKATLKRVPNAQGHHDVVAPTLTMTATGYETLTMPVPIDVPTVNVEMSPAVNALKPGKNTITVTARDAATGAPVEMRVMAGDRVVGNTNLPLQFELAPGKKRPEIWVTSLFNRYSDVVVAPAQ